VKLARGLDQVVAAVMDLKRMLDVVEEEVVDGDEEEEELVSSCPDAKRRRTFLK
jgi:hypothetical protein